MQIKNLLYFSSCLIISIIFTACSSSSVEEIPSQAEDELAIGFNAKVNSRALANIDSVKTNGFSVWGGYDKNNVFSGDKVTFTNGDWDYGTPKYWVLNKTYNF